MWFVYWLIWSIVAMATSEYILHKYTMHKRFFPKGILDSVFELHHIEHHKNNRYDVNVDLPIYYHILISCPLWITLLILKEYDGLIAFFIVISHHSLYWTKLHRASHDLENNWTKYLPNVAFYKTMRDHHLNHHRYPNKNYGVVYPWIDYIFSTKINWNDN